MSPKPRLWTVVAAFFATLAIQIVGGGALMIHYAGEARPGGLVGASPAEIKALIATPGVLSGIFAASAASLLVVVLVAARLTPRPWRARFHFASLRASPLDVLLVLVCSFAIGDAAERVGALTGTFSNSSVSAMQHASASAAPSMAVPLALLGVVVGVLEEVFYRGYVQTRLVSRFGVVAGVVASAFVFGLMHFDLVQSPFAFGFGLVVGYVAVRTGGIATGLYAHAINNLLAFTMPRFMTSGADDAQHTPVIALAIAALAFVASFTALLVRLRRRVPAEIAEPPVEGAQKTPALALVLGGCGSFALIVVIVLGGVVFALRGAVGGMPTNEQHALAASAGSASAGRDDFTACVTDALAFTRACKDTTCAQQGRTFLDACLAHAAPSAGFCDGVPKRSGLRAVGEWGTAACKERGGADLPGCVVVVGAVPSFCTGR